MYERWIDSDDEWTDLNEIYKDWIDSMILLCKGESIQINLKLLVFVNRFKLLVMTFWTDSNLQKWIKTLCFVWIDSNSQLWLLNRFKYTKTILDDLRKARNTHKQTKECFMHARSFSARWKGFLNLEGQITHDLKLS